MCFRTQPLLCCSEMYQLILLWLFLELFSSDANKLTNNIWNISYPVLTTWLLNCFVNAISYVQFCCWFCISSLTLDLQPGDTRKNKHTKVSLLIYLQLAAALFRLISRTCVYLSVSMALNENWFQSCRDWPTRHFFFTICPFNTVTATH